MSDGTNSVAGGGWEGAFSKSKKGAPETGPNSHNQPKAKTSVRSRGKARLVTLDCMGRGDFANRTFRFESRSPLHYIPIGQHLATNVRTKILAVLTDQALTAKQIAAKLEIAPGTARNAIARLQQLGLVKKTKKQSCAQFYALTETSK